MGWFASRLSTMIGADREALVLGVGIKAFRP